MGARKKMRVNTHIAHRMFTECLSKVYIINLYNNWVTYILNNKNKIKKTFHIII